MTQTPNPGRKNPLDSNELFQAERLVRIEMKLDALTSSVERRLLLTEATNVDYGKRLERLERVIWLMSGTFLLFGVPTLLALVYELIQRLF